MPTYYCDFVSNVYIGREVFTVVIMGNVTHILPVSQWLEVVIAFVSSLCIAIYFHTLFANLLKKCSIFLLIGRAPTDSEEETKLLRCLKKSMLSPYQKQVICLPSSSVTDRGTLSPLSKTETRSSPRSKGLTSKMKLSPRHESTSKTRLLLRRSTPSKRVVAKTRMSTPLRKTKHFHADVRKKTGLTPRRTPSRKRSQTPRKSTKRTPAKSTSVI